MPNDVCCCIESVGFIRSELGVSDSLVCCYICGATQWGIIAVLFTMEIIDSVYQTSRLAVVILNPHICVFVRLLATHRSESEPISDIESSQ